MYKIIKYSLSLLLLLGILSSLVHAQQNSSLTYQQKNQQAYPFFPQEGIRRAYKDYKPYDIINFSDVPIVFNNGVLFTMYGKDDDEINVSGSFFEWQKKLPMQRGSYGIYYAFLEKNLAAGNYEYKFQVNGMWQNHMEQKLVTFNAINQKVSYFTIKEAIYNFPKSPVHINNNIFRFYLKQKNYSRVSLISSSNNLDPKAAPMELKNGFWTIEKRIEPEQSFYAFYVDGELMLDPANPYLSQTPYHMQLNYIHQQFYQETTQN